jgi:hypothetical protein
MRVQKVNLNQIASNISVSRFSQGYLQAAAALLLARLAGLNASRPLLAKSDSERLFGIPHDPDYGLAVV